MSMLVAIGTAIDNNGRVIRAAVTLDLVTAIVCSRLANNGWEPLYFITKAGEQQAIPPCFALNDDALEALDALDNAV